MPKQLQLLVVETQTDVREMEREAYAKEVSRA